MKPFKETKTMVAPNGEVLTIEQFSKLAYSGSKIKVFLNDVYTVFVRDYPKRSEEETGLVWLSIKRNDKEPIHDWRDLQTIKNELIGAECEGVELYPAESRKVDTANQYHLWVIPDTKFRFPIGFNERVVGNSDTASAIGAKQRAISEDEVTHTTEELKVKIGGKV